MKDCTEEEAAEIVRQCMGPMVSNESAEVLQLPHYEYELPDFENMPPRPWRLPDHLQHSNPATGFNVEEPEIAGTGYAAASAPSPAANEEPLQLPTYNFDHRAVSRPHTSDRPGHRQATVNAGAIGSGDGTGEEPLGLPVYNW